jgi:hypothetical protein
MSLGDYLRYLRAVKGDLTPWDIEEATGVPSGHYRQMEQRYRAVGDDEALVKLAAYFQVPLEELTWRREKSRKALSTALDHAQQTAASIRLQLRMPPLTFSGKVLWWDLGATLLELDDGSGQVVIQRCMVDDWELLGVEEEEG